MNRKPPVASSVLAADWEELLAHLPDETAARDIQSEGFEYACAGQAATLALSPGLIEARVQGRAPSRYRVKIELPRFDDQQWNRIISTLAGQARIAAAMIHGELPGRVVAILKQMNLSVVPQHLHEITFHCSCAGPRIGHHGLIGPCKHAVALWYLITERLDREPQSAFLLRGMDRGELHERIRLQRHFETGNETAHTVPSIDVPVNDDRLARNARNADDYWRAGPELNEVTTTLGPPEVPHALLRRLGASPFAQRSRFPLVGLLATCYDIIAESARAEQLPDEDAPRRSENGV